HPGEAVLRMADIVVVAKADMAPASGVQELMEGLPSLCPQAHLVRGGSPLRLEGAVAVQGKRVIVVEDGPTTTHGGMAYGAGYVAASRAQAGAIIDPRPWAPPAIARVYQQYPQIGPVLPAMGYSPEQLEALGATLNQTPADLIVSGTPIDLGALLPLNKPIHRVRYEFADLDSPGLGDRVDLFLAP
ncbi:MAG: GTPase, partial [Cyanobacteriota bacterium]|nr:GTPase [Cyanobacteriota bacterium]